MRKLPLVGGITTIVFLLITVGICTTMAQSIEDQGIMSAALSTTIIMVVLGLSVFERGEAILALCVAIVTPVLVLVAGGSFVSGYGIAGLIAPYIEGYCLFAATIATAISFVLVLFTYNITREKIEKKEIVPTTILMTVINFGIFYWVPGLI